MSTELLTYQRITWVNIERPAAEDLSYLREHFPFHPLDLEDITSRTELPKMDVYDDYLFIVMHFPVFDHTRHLSTPSEVYFFVGLNYLVTVHDGRLKPISRLFADCQETPESRARFMGQGSGRLLYAILDRLVDYLFPILTKVGGQIRDIEENLFTADMEQMINRIALVRRDIIALRSILRPQLKVMHVLERGRHPFFQEELEVYFGDITDGFSKAVEIVDDYYEIIHGLSDTSMALTSYRINEVIRILTIISVILLPLSVISGIFGMNVPLPLSHSAWSFWLILLLMILVAGAMLAYFRHKRWL